MLEFYNYELRESIILDRLPLSLFVLWFCTDNTNYTFAADNNTLITDFFDRWTDFHRREN